MKQISFWAHDHKVSARIAIILLYLLLNISGLFIGDILFSMDISLPIWLLVLACMLTIAGTIWYPLKKRKHLYLNYYNRQKFADGLLVTATFIFIVFTGNQLNNTKDSFIGRSFAINIISNPSMETSPNISIDKKAKEKSLSKKQQRKSFKRLIKSIRKSYKDQDKSTKTIMIILVVLGAIFLTYLMIGLGCSIACSGAEALGYIVSIVGVAGVIFGAVKLIQRITRGKPKKEIETTPSPSQ